jgi:acyl dehydratase
MDSRITDDLKSWIGREVTYTAPDDIGRAAFRYFALATGDDNPIYRDDTFAKATRHGGVIAPPTLVCETNQFMDQPLDGDGYVGHKWDLPLPHARFIRGGNDYELHQPMRPDDRVSVTWRIVDIYERKTQKFGALIFVVSDARYVNQRGELLATNRETNIYAP